MLLQVILLLATLLFYLRWRMRLPANFPPGPRNHLPLIGDAWQLDKDLSASLNNLADKYGKVFGLYLGPVPTVIINDYDLANVSYNLVDLKMFV